MADPFSDTNEAAKRLADKAARDTAAKQAGRAATQRMVDTKAKAARNPNDDIGYKPFPRNDGWPFV